MVVTYLLTAAANPPDRLGEIPELLDPLGLRVRAATVAAMGADPFRGRVEDDPGRWLDATLALWKLDVRRIPVEVLCPPTPSVGPIINQSSLINHSKLNGSSIELNAASSYRCCRVIAWIHAWNPHSG